MGATAIRSLSNNREMREFLEEVEGLGFAAEKTSGNHIRLTHPDVPEPIFAPSTPSDWRSIANARSLVRRALRQAQEEKPALTPVSTSQLGCGICRGRGDQNLFPSVAALNEHVASEHPAPPLPSTAPRQKEETMSEAANVVEIDKKSGKRVELPELIEWLEDYLGGPGRTITRQKLIAELGEEATSATEILRQRGKDKRIHLHRLISKGSGVYMWATPNWEPEAPAAKKTAPRKPEKVTPPAEDKGTIFEVVNKFVDGQFLVRDEEGNLFTAALRPL